MIASPNKLRAGSLGRGLPGLIYACLPWITLTLAALILGQDVIGFWRLPDVPLKAIEAETGFCFTTALPGALVRPPGRIALVTVAEDGRPLNGATLDHNGVRQLGHGLFAVWDTKLLFSSSDNSSPLTNGRMYSISGPRQLPGWLTPAGLILAAFSYLLVFHLRPADPNNHRRGKAWEWTALSLILLIAGLWRAKMPSVALAWPDSWLYSSMSFEWETHRQLTPTMRELVYQVFVTAVMHLGQSPRLLVGLQHMFGLIAAGLLFVAVGNVRRVTPLRPWTQAAIGLLALGTALAWALSTIPAYYELYLMPEALFHVLSAAAMALATAALCPTPSTPRGVFTSGLLASGGAFILLMLYTTVPRWGFGVLLAPVLLYLVLRRPGFSKAQRRGFWLAPFGALLALVITPNILLHRKYEPQGNYFLQMHLLCIQADIILPEIEEEARAPQPKFPSRLLDAVSADIRREMQRYADHPSGPTPSLHFNADQLMYEESVIAELRREFGDRPQEIREFAMYFYLKAWREQPAAMLGKIMRQLATVYGDPATLFDARGFEFIATDDVPLSRRVLEGQIEGHGGAGPWAGMPGLLRQAEQDRTAYSPTAVVQKLHEFAAKAYLPVLIACVLVFGWGGRRGARSPGRATSRAMAPLALMGFAAGFLSCSTIAVIHTLDPGRYRETLLAVSLFAVASAIAALLVTVDSLLRPRDNPTPKSGETAAG
jgi:hypothetical protein